MVLTLVNDIHLCSHLNGNFEGISADQTQSASTPGPGPGPSPVPRPGRPLEQKAPPPLHRPAPPATPPGSPRPSPANKKCWTSPRTKREKHADLPGKFWKIHEFVEKSMKIKWICILLLKLMSIYNAFITNMGELDNSFKICNRTTYIGIYRANIFV